MSWEIVAIGVGAPVVSLAGSILVYTRSRHVDKVAEQSGLATESRAGIQQVLDAGNKINDQLQKYLDQAQEDNKDWRERFAEQRSQLEACFGRSQDLVKELNRMYRKFGNGDTPPEGTPATK